MKSRPNPKQLSAKEKEEFLQAGGHIPHRLCLLRTFRIRQEWFAQSCVQERPDGDFLRCSKDAALISIRLFANFLGIRLNKKSQSLNFTTDPTKLVCFDPDSDVFVDELGGDFVPDSRLTKDEQDLLVGLLARADAELAHLTSRFGHHDSHNTAKALCDGTALIEALLKEFLYDKIGRGFPDFEAERRIDRSKWNFKDSVYGDAARFGPPNNPVS